MSFVAINACERVTKTPVALCHLVNQLFGLRRRVLGSVAEKLGFRLQEATGEWDRGEPDT